MTARILAAHVVAVLVLAVMVVTLVAAALHGESVVDGLPYLILMLTALAMGWLLAIRVPGNSVGWILIGIPALFLVTGPVGLLADAMRGTAPGVAVWLDWYAGTDDDPSWSWVPPVWLLLGLLPLRFPTGRLPSPRWRWFQAVSMAAAVLVCALIGVIDERIGSHAPNPAHLTWVPPWTIGVGFLLLSACLLTSIASLFVRYRGGDAQARAQLRWMLWAVALAVTGLVLGWLSTLYARALSPFFQWELLVGYCLIPIAVAVSVLRYRLYEIDRIISRTASYLLVTLVLIGTYAVVVLGASALLGPRSAIATALATLAAAAVFLPVLRVVRRGVDRVFNRRQYDAERVVASFGERLRTADPHDAGEGLVAAIEQSLEPAAVGIWLAR